MARAALLVALSLDYALAVPYPALNALQPSSESKLPATKDPYDWKELVTIEGAHKFDRSGWQVDISRDGQVLAIGAPRSDQGAKRSGSVRVFEISNGTTWIQRGDQFDGKKKDDNLGFSVSLSKDGNTLAMGTPLSDETGHDSGSVRIYEWKPDAVAGLDGLWEQKGGDIYGDGDESDQCGYSISLSSDGNTVAVGLPFNDPFDAENNETIIGGGVARVYRWKEGAWELMGNEIQGDQIGDNAGLSVKLNDDATVLAVGSPRHNDSMATGPADGSLRFHAGRVRVFEWSEETSTWVLRGEAIEGEATNDRAGQSLAISADGSILAVGSPNHNGPSVGTHSGSMRVFKWDGSTWSQLGSTILGEGQAHKFGTSVAMAAEGTLLAVGAPFYTVNVGALPNKVGRVGTYAWNATLSDWVKIAADVTGDRTCDSAGWSTSISADGTHLAAGIIQRGVAHPADYDNYLGVPQEDIDAVENATAFQELYAQSKLCSGAGEVRVYAVYKCEFVTDWWGGSKNPVPESGSGRA